MTLTPPVDDKVKFLIIRFSSIGDIVLTTPVIRCLKEQVEGAEVHFLTKKAFKPVLQENPYIDKLHVLEDSFSNTTRQLIGEDFDYVIDLHSNLRTMRFKRKLKLISFSFKKLNLEKWLLVNFKKNKLPDNHIVDRYLETTRLFSVENDNKGLDYFIPEETKKTIVKQLDINSEYIVIVIGANHFTKQLPDEKIAEITSATDKTVVFLGGKQDIEKAKSVEGLLRNKTVINLTGCLSLNESALAVKHAALVITPDTGLMHIAAAFKKKIISVWGNTVPEFGMYPYMADKKSVLYEVKGLSCRPCSKIGHEKCPKGHFKCMETHNANDIVKDISKLLAG